MRVLIIAASPTEPRIHELEVEDDVEFAEDLVGGWTPSPLFRDPEVGYVAWTEDPPWTDPRVNAHAARLFDLPWPVLLDAGLDEPRAGRDSSFDAVIPRGPVVVVGAAYHAQADAWHIFGAPDELTAAYLAELPAFRDGLEEWSALPGLAGGF